MLVQVLQNAALLGFAALGLHVIWRHRPFADSLLGQCVIGLNFGFVTFMVIAAPVEVEGGAIIDARAGPVIVAGIVGGPVAASVAAILGAIARGYVGGSFVLSAVVAFLLYALVGALLWQRSFVRQLGDGVSWRRILAGTLLSIIAAALVYFVIQPRSLAQDWLLNVFPLIVLANGLSIALMGYLASATLASADQRTELQQAFETLNTAKKAGGISLWTYDPKTKAFTWDDAHRAMHGSYDDDGSGCLEAWARRIHPEDVADWRDMFEAALCGRATFDVSYRLDHPDGRQRTLKTNGVAVRDSASGPPVRLVGATVDLTPLVEKERELAENREIALQAQRLEAIGKLTGGVAHDFNNLLTVILGNIELAREQVADADVLQCLAQSEQATLRGAELVKSMLSFARQAALQPDVFNLNTVLKELQSWVNRTLPESIEVRASLEDGLWPVYVDRSAFETALLNLILNAQDAMEGCGTLELSTSNVEIEHDDPESATRDLDPGPYVQLAVTDDGRGISPDILHRVFDPFFSTKGVGAGSGLGLSMVQGFVKQSGGSVGVQSTPGEGATFRLYFPARTSPDRPAPTTGYDPAQDGRLSAKVLLVEDESDVRKVMAKSLRSVGYSVIEAASGDEALAAFGDGALFHVVVTDIVMPGSLQGPALAQKIRSVRPSIPVIFMSGYGGDAQIRGSGLSPSDTRLIKPVQRAELIRTIESALPKAAQTS